MPVAKGLRVDDLREEGLRTLVTVQNVILRTFLVVEDDLQRKARAIWPIWVGWLVCWFVLVGFLFLLVVVGVVVCVAVVVLFFVVVGFVVTVGLLLVF